MSESAARAVLEAHITALNAHDEVGLAATLHFPHYRLADGAMKVWETSDEYFRDFKARAGDDWHHSAFADVRVVHASDAKFHLSVRVDRFRADGSLLTSFPSLWVMALIDGRWAAQVRSTLAAK